MDLKWILVILQIVSNIICLYLALYTTRNYKKIIKNSMNIKVYYNGNWITYDEYTKQNKSNV